ncbi:MAG: hypothetical protein HPY55_03150 [Firmicutes bacterium]|nr:hypothetical protein [Bacillota bacterium]
MGTARRARLPLILVAGGSCGNAMQRAAERIRQASESAGVQAQVLIQNLWERAEPDSRADVIVQMFPFFSALDVPVLDGRPFILGKGEDELLARILSLICEEARQ